MESLSRPRDHRDHYKLWYKFIPYYSSVTENKDEEFLCFLHVSIGLFLLPLC